MTDTPESTEPAKVTCPTCGGHPKEPSVRIEGGSVSCRFCNRTFTFNMMRDRGAAYRKCSCQRARDHRCETCGGDGIVDAPPPAVPVDGDSGRPGGGDGWVIAQALREWADDQDEVAAEYDTHSPDRADDAAEMRRQAAVARAAADRHDAPPAPPVLPVPRERGADREGLPLGDVDPLHTCYDSCAHDEPAPRPPVGAGEGDEAGAMHLCAEDRFHLWVKLYGIQQETEPYRFGQPRHDLTLDHIYEEVTAALSYFDPPPTRPAPPVGAGEGDALAPLCIACSEPLDQLPDGRVRPCIECLADTITEPLTGIEALIAWAGDHCDDDDYLLVEAAEAQFTKCLDRIREAHAAIEQHDRSTCCAFPRPAPPVGAGTTVDDGEVTAWPEGDGYRLSVQTNEVGDRVSHLLSAGDAAALAVALAPPVGERAGEDEDRYWVKVQRSTWEAEQAAKDARRVEAAGGRPDPHPLEALLRAIVDPEEAADCALAVIEAGMYQSAAPTPKAGA